MRERAPARPGVLGWVVALALLALGSVWLPQFYVLALAEILILSIVALSLNLLLGYTGLVSFGHAAYFGLGAYTCGLLLKLAGWPLLPAALAGALSGFVAGALVGLVTLHRQEVYFAMLTLAFGQIAHTVVFKWYGLTGGDNGLVGIPRPPLDLGVVQLDLSDPRRFLLFTIVVWAGLVGAMARITRSPFGLLAQAMRESRERCEFIGLPVRSQLVAVYALSTGVAGAAGSLFALFQQSIFPNLLHWTTSGGFLMMTLLGGIHSFYGPLVGTVVYRALDLIVTGLTTYQPLVMGLMLIGLVLFMPGGIAGRLEALQGRWQWKSVARLIRRGQEVRGDGLS